MHVRLSESLAFCATNLLAANVLISESDTSDDPENTVKTIKIKAAYFFILL